MNAVYKAIARRTIWHLVQHLSARIKTVGEGAELCGHAIRLRPDQELFEVFAPKSETDYEHASGSFIEGSSMPDARFVVEAAHNHQLVHISHNLLRANPGLLEHPEHALQRWLPEAVKHRRYCTRPDVQTTDRVLYIEPHATLRKITNIRSAACRTRDLPT